MRSAVSNAASWASVVRPAIVARDRACFRAGAVLVADGIVQRDAGVVNLVAARVALAGNES